MPRKKRTIVEETLPDVAETESDDITDFTCVLTKVHKLSGADRFFCFQTDTPVDEVLIQSQYPAGGKFIVTEYNALGKMIDTRMTNIEAKPFSPMANGNGGEDIRARMLLEELAFTRNMMLQLIQGLTNQKQSMATATPLGELAQAMTLIHGLSPQTSAADLILKGMDLGMKANGNNGDWKTALVDTAKDIAPVVVQAFSAARQVQQGQPQMIALPPAAMLKQGLDWLKPRIIAGMEPDLAVNWVITNANDPLCNQLLTQAAQGFDSFVAADPEIVNEPFKTWFTTAIQQLKDWYAAQSADQTDSNGGTGNDSDVADDAGNRSGKSTLHKVS